MGLVGDVGGLLTREWERFVDGTRALTGDEWRAYELARGRQGRTADEAASVNIPGWDDVIRLGPRYRATPDEVREFYRARRAGEAPAISPEAKAAIEGYREFVTRVRTSAQPEYSQGWGQILTAVDNVQDLVSTLTTFGRLALWAGPRLTGLLDALTVGQLRPLLGLGARVGGRFVPVLGWGILASDVLNLLGLTGMLASPLYNLLCGGPSAALAAGAPTLLFKRGLKQEIWNAARRNPFGRTARLDARSRAVGRLPTIGNLFEVAQTTEQLFGWGVSLGGIVGAITEGAAVLGGATGDSSVTVRGGWGLSQLGEVAGARARSMSSVERELFATSSRVLRHAPSLMATQDTFTTEDHLAALVAYAAALPIVLRELPPVWDHPDFATVLERDLIVGPHVRPETALLLELEGLELGQGARWPVPGAPRSITVADYVSGQAPRIAAATADFIRRRRDEPAGVFAAAVVAQATEAVWLQLTGDTEALAFQLAPDFQLVAGLAEDGFLVAGDAPGADLWGFWQAARRLVEAKSGFYPGLTPLRELAEAHSVPLVKMLPPDAPWPAAWGEVGSGSRGGLPTELRAALPADVLRQLDQLAQQPPAPPAG